MKFYDRIADHSRLRTGDIILVPMDKAKAMALTPRALGKYGVSSGFTSRSDNKWETLQKLYTDRLAHAADEGTKNDVAFVVAGTREKYCYNDAAVKLEQFFGNDVGRHSGDREPQYASVTLRPVPLDVVRGLAIASRDSASEAYWMCRTQLNTELSGSGIEPNDIYNTFDNHGTPDSVYNNLADALGLCVRYGQTVPYVHGYTAGYERTDQLTEIVSDTMIDDYTGRECAIVLTPKAVGMMAKRGAILLRPTAAASTAVARRIVEWIGRTTAEFWTKQLDEYRKVMLKAALAEPARLGKRIASWRKRSSKAASGAYKVARNSMKSEIERTVKNG